MADGLDPLARAVNEAQDRAEARPHDDEAWVAYHRLFRQWQQARREVE